MIHVIRNSLSTRDGDVRPTWHPNRWAGPLVPQSRYSGVHLRLVCSRHSCGVIHIIQAVNKIPAENFWSALLSPDHTQRRKVGLCVAFLLKLSRLLPETWLATPIAVSNREYVPLLLGHLGNAQATLLKDLHVLQNTTILCVFLELLELDHVRKLLYEFDMHKAPLRFLTVRFLVEVRVLGVEGGFSKVVQPSQRS